jgi:hypothetical protein
MKVTYVHDQLVVIGEKVENAYLVNMERNGFPASWEPFLKSIFAWEKLPNFERFWDDCV